ncbi:hypothetical protein THRCLA_22562, partial [Thraustotheca clavata]
TYNINLSKGTVQNYLAESTENVAFRANYLQKKLNNRNNKNYPIVPEIFLDKSYCNERHTAQLSRVDCTNVNYQPSGKGDRYCIVAAGMKYTNAS